MGATKLTDLGVSKQRIRGRVGDGKNCCEDKIEIEIEHQEQGESRAQGEKAHR